MRQNILRKTGWIIYTKNLKFLRWKNNNNNWKRKKEKKGSLLFTSWSCGGLCTAVSLSCFGTPVLPDLLHVSVDYLFGQGSWGLLLLCRTYSGGFALGRPNRAKGERSRAIPRFGKSSWTWLEPDSGRCLSNRMEGTFAANKFGKHQAILVGFYWASLIENPEK